jgi:hypothetical protein
MSVLGSLLIRMLADRGFSPPSATDVIPIDVLAQYIAFPVFVGFLLVTFLSMYFLGESKSSARFGLSSSAITSIKHTSLNFLIVSFGAIFFTFLLWQMYFPLPYWGDQTTLITVIGLLLGISFGFMTFYTLYRRQ